MGAPLGRKPHRAQNLRLWILRIDQTKEGVLYHRRFASQLNNQDVDPVAVVQPAHAGVALSVPEAGPKRQATDGRSSAWIEKGLLPLGLTRFPSDSRPPSSP